MRYALIGCGRIANNHIKAAKQNGLTISAVCDLIPSRMEEIIVKFDLQDQPIGRYTDYKKMLEEIQPTLVAIATDSGSHASIALACIEAGVNVIIEKPIALSLTDADAIIESAKMRGIKVCACHQNRFNLSIQSIREALEQGRFGKMSHGTIHVRWNRGPQYYEQASWRGTWAQDGGALMNQSIHGIDLLCWMMGDEPQEVFAYTAQQFHPYLECEDVGLAVVKFSNGAIGTIEGTTNVYPQNLEETLYLFGEKGTIKAGGKSVNTIEEWSFADKQSQDEVIHGGLEEKTSNVYGNGHSSLYADMIEAITVDRPPYIDGSAGRRALEMVLAIYKSALSGQPVKLPMKTGSTIEFAKAFD